MQVLSSSQYMMIHPDKDLKADWKAPTLPPAYKGMHYAGQVKAQEHALMNNQHNGSWATERKAKHWILLFHHNIFVPIWSQFLNITLANAKQALPQSTTTSKSSKQELSVYLPAS